MKKNRYLLCLLISGLLLYYAVPRLNIFGPGAEGVFAYVWLGFALVVIAGNLTALLYTPKQQNKQQLRTYKERRRVKSRYFY